jgi:reverse gyrase
VAAAKAEADRRMLDFTTSSSYKGLQDLVEVGNQMAQNQSDAKVEATELKAKLEVAAAKLEVAAAKGEAYRRILDFITSSSYNGPRDLVEVRNQMAQHQSDAIDEV